MLPQRYNRRSHSTKLHKSKRVDRRSYWQKGDQPATNTRMNPSISWLSLWLFHHFLCSVLKKKTALKLYSSVWFLMKGDSMDLFLQKDSFVSSLRFQQFLDINRAVYVRLISKRRLKLKKDKTVTKITRLFSLYQWWTDKLYGQE